MKNAMRGKIHLTILFAILIGFFFAYYLKEAKEQTTIRLTLLGEITELERHRQELNSEILHSGFFLYHDYDPIHASLDRFANSLITIDQLYSRVESDRHSLLRPHLEELRRDFEQREQQLIRFLSVNSMLKNSAMYIPLLGRRIMEAVPDHQYHALLAGLTSGLYLARNSLDPDLLPGFRQALDQLAARKPQSAEPTATEALRLHRALLAHSLLFQELLPEYSQLLQAGLDPAVDRLIVAMAEALKTENSAWLSRLNRLTYLFFAAFMGAVGLIIFLLLRAERENKTLNQLSTALTAAATTDRLTQLANRFAFDSDQNDLERPLLLLINIDDFRHINDLYGTTAGDYILAGLAGLLERNRPKAAAWSRCYRLGGDDFGLLLEEPAGFNPEELAGRILAELEAAEFVFREQPLRFTISLGITRQRPLLETADLALKEIKKLKRSRYLLYSDELNLQERIAANLATLQLARRALETDNVLVYYQPIVDNLSGEIVKFESLVRIRDQDGSILAPGRFLDVVKESALYPEFTKRVVSKSFAEMSDCICEFSLNLAVADILDTEVRDYILQMIADQPEVARRLTFEILENEGMENVEMVQAFIEKVKAAGCRIAVDDFGSGYSNFAHILTLRVDSIKIDASLIRHLDDDTQARVLVHTIVDFCRKLGIRTVAEFVHSAKVHEVVKQLGIDYSQGYHLGEPAPRGRLQ